MKRQKLELMTYWYSRPATLRECTSEFLSFLSKLKKHHPIFFNVWYGTSSTRSKKEALSSKIVFTHECIKKEFSKRDRENDYPEFNYVAGVWNGKDDFESMTVSARLGGRYLKYVYNRNNCMVELPSEGLVYTYYQAPAHQLELIKLMIAHWKPVYIRIHDNTKDILPPFTDEKLLQAIKENVLYYPETS